jgi:hypothetical protein
VGKKTFDVVEFDLPTLSQMFIISTGAALNTAFKDFLLCKNFMICHKKKDLLVRCVALTLFLIPLDQRMLRD